MSKPRFLSFFSFSACACALLSHLSAAPAHAQTLELEAVEIQTPAADALATSQARLDQVPGATNLITEQRLQYSSSQSSAELLAYQPGIYAQSAGNEGIRLSIRGSGINRATGAHGSGTYVMLDGLALTGPGGTPYELQEPLWMDHLQVYRGANGWEQGALALGGAVNIHSPDGRNASPLTLRYETGSFGWQKRHISSGGHNQQADYFIALTDSDYDGYQKHAAGSSQGLMLNVGYQFSPQLETRLYLRYRETEHQTPGRLTLDQIKHAPRSANPSNVLRDSQRPQPGSTWLASKTTWQLDELSQLEFGLAWHDYPMDLQESSNRVKIAYRDLSSHLAYQRQHQLFGLNSQSRLSFRSTAYMPSSGASEWVRINGNYPVGTHTRDYQHNGSDAVLQAANALQLSDNLWLDTGLALIYTRREVQVSQPRQDQAVNLSDWDYAPRLGLRYSLSPNSQLFANLSRSVEAPHAWSMLWSSNQKFPSASGPASGMISQGIKLQNQTATSLEVGGRGETEIGHWELAYYYARVRHEHLTVERLDHTGFPYRAEANASPTVHQGIEAGLDSSLLQTQSGEWRLRQAYTWSRFNYRNDPRFGDNSLPGLPEHLYQAELRFNHHAGWFVGINHLSSSRVAIDYANSTHAPSYSLWGASLGYQTPNERWNLWLEARNLTDQRYASTVLPGYDDQGQDAARLSPGEGRGFYTGFSFRL